MTQIPQVPLAPPLTKKQKIIIISIAVFLLLSYLSTLGLFATQDNEPRDEESEPPAWTKTLSSVMSVFATKVTLDGLTCNGNPVSSEFTLNSSSADCTITFNESSLPDYQDRGENDLWKTEVEVLSSNTKIFTRYESSSCSGTTDSGKIKTTSLPASALGLTHLASKTNDEGNVTGIYKESELNCWLEQEDSDVSFTISQAGESLILSCTRCTTPVTLKLVE